MKISENLFAQSKQVIPGGVNSPLRAFQPVGGVPPFFALGMGSKIIDEDNKQYIDYVGAWGPAILGHGRDKVVEAVKQQVDKGFGFGAPHKLELEIAKLITTIVPSVEKVRLMNSGTEAAMSAIRLARGITGQDKFIKFAGCYHGHSDSLLASAGSGVATLVVPGTPGVPTDVVKNTLVLPFNDADALSLAFKTHAKTLAAVIIEPIAGNMNFIRPDLTFLNILVQLCEKHQVLLIVDEVMTGFRIALLGAQGTLDLVPDLTIFGKVIGGGMPLAAVGGKAKYMDYFAPIGSVYQAGTLSGNPVAVSAGLATLRFIQSNNNFYQALNDRLGQLIKGVREIASRLNFPIAIDGEGGMFGFLLGAKHMPKNLSDLSLVDQALFARFFHQMLDRGVYLAPSIYECCFLSFAHTPADIDKTLAHFESALKSVISSI